MKKGGKCMFNLKIQKQKLMQKKSKKIQIRKLDMQKVKNNISKKHAKKVGGV